LAKSERGFEGVLGFAARAHDQHGMINEEIRVLGFRGVVLADGRQPCTCEGDESREDTDTWRASYIQTATINCIQVAARLLCNPGHTTGTIRAKYEWLSGYPPSPRWREIGLECDAGTRSVGLSLENFSSQADSMKTMTLGYFF
jgi:hypothetical protein